MHFNLFELRIHFLVVVQTFYFVFSKGNIGKKTQPPQDTGTTPRPQKTTRVSQNPSVPKTIQHPHDTSQNLRNYRIGCGSVKLLGPQQLLRPSVPTQQLMPSVPETILHRHNHLLFLSLRFRFINLFLLSFISPN